MDEEPRAADCQTLTHPLSGTRRVEAASRLVQTIVDTVSGVVTAAGMRLELARMRLLPPALLAGQVHADAEDEAGWRFLRRPALLGFVALASVALGASLPSSPFKLEMAGTWFFGEPAPGQDASHVMLLVGLVATYGGLLLIIRVWYGLIKALGRRPGIPIRYLWMILALWMVPMLVVAPIFSRDVYSYAAQAEMMSRHINPYHYGPAVLGSGPFVSPVDPLWRLTYAPYGPFFLMIGGALASLSGHNELVTVVLLRLLEVAGVAMIGACIPALARSYGRDVGPAFVIAVLNPLVVLTLIGGAHNDAIMVGLLVVGLTAARTRHPYWAVLLCTLAAAVKAPAALGLVYVGWTWLGTDADWRHRVRHLAVTGAIATAIMAALSWMAGLGWGWVLNLDTPGTVRSWIAPSTTAQIIVTGLLHQLGIGVGGSTVLSVLRVLGLGAAAVAGLVLLWRSDQLGHLRAAGITLLLFVVLGPVVQPWYLTWGLVLLAPVAIGRLRTTVICLSAVSPFLGLPGASTLLSDLLGDLHSNPFAVLGAIGILVGVLVLPLGPWSSGRPWDRRGAAFPLALEG